MDANVSNGLVDQKERSIEIDEDEQERLHFQRIVNAFRYYRVHSLRRVYKAEKDYENLPKRHQEMIPKFMDQMQKMKNCIEHNYQIVKLVIQNTDQMFENKTHGPEEITDSVSVKSATEFDMDKIRSTLKQVVRDWSSVGAAERNACYTPVLEEIIERFPLDKCNPADVSVLVPGAGLGRLAFEIAKKGYTCQGNEFSLFMLFMSNFILNRCRNENMYIFYPWIHQFCNNISVSDQIQSVEFPDVNPSDLPPKAQFSMTAGDFLDVYTEPDTFDCIATVFFLDTAHNIIEYVETIHKILKPGGYWINFGPLLYHFADMPNESSIELSYEDVKEVIKKFNFNILKEAVDVPATYTQRESSMLQYRYNCVFLVCQKPHEPNRGHS